MTTVITSEMATLISAVTGGVYDFEKAEKVLRQSLMRTNTGKIEDSLFLKVCQWLYHNVDKIQASNSQSELVNTISDELTLNPGSVRNCLVTHPFIIPERLKPKRIESLRKGGPEPPSTKFITTEVPILKPLYDVYELQKDMRAFETHVPNDIVSHWVKVKMEINKLLKDEFDLIEKVLKDASRVATEKPTEKKDLKE